MGNYFGYWKHVVLLLCVIIILMGGAFCWHYHDYPMPKWGNYLLVESSQIDPFAEKRIYLYHESPITSGLVGRYVAKLRLQKANRHAFVPTKAGDYRFSYLGFAPEKDIVSYEDLIVGSLQIDKNGVLQSSVPTGMNPMADFIRIKEVDGMFAFEKRDGGVVFVGVRNSTLLFVCPDKGCLITIILKSSD